MSPRRNWDSPNPSLASECAPPPRSGGKPQSPAGEGLGESQLRRLEKKLSTLPTLCQKAALKRAGGSRYWNFRNNLWGLGTEQLLYMVVVPGRRLYIGWRDGIDNQVASPTDDKIKFQLFRSLSTRRNLTTVKCALKTQLHFTKHYCVHFNI